MGPDLQRKPPSPDTAFQGDPKDPVQGVRDRDQARRDISKEMDSIRRFNKIDRQINRALRRDDPGKANQFLELKKSLGGNSFDIGNNAILNTDDVESQARANYEKKAAQRDAMGNNQRDKNPNAAENVQGVANNNPPEIGEANGKPDTGGPNTNAVPAKDSPIIPGSDQRSAAAEGIESTIQERKKPKLSGHIDTKQKFLDDLEGSDLIKASRGLGEGDPNSEDVIGAQEKAYERADKLGVKREDLQRKMGWETDADAMERVAKERDAKAKSASEAVRGEVGESEEGAYEAGVKKFEEMGLTRADYDRVRKEKFEANAGAREKTAKTANEARALVEPAINDYLYLEKVSKDLKKKSEQAKEKERLSRIAKVLKDSFTSSSEPERLMK